MKRPFETMRPLLRLAVRRPLLVLLIAAALTALALSQATRLSIDTDLANLLPPEYPSVQALERLRETVGGETLLDVGIRSPSFEANRQFAEALIPRMMALRTEDGEPRFARYDYRRDTTFLASNGLYFATDQELDQLAQLLADEAEQARLEANPFYFDLDDDLGLDEEFDERAADLTEALEPFVPSEFFISEDSTHLAVRFLPTGSRANLGFVRSTYAAVDELIADIAPASHHPDMVAVAGGRLLWLQVEIETITNDVQRSFGAGVLAVLLFVTLYFLYKSVQVRGPSRRALLSSLARTPLTALLLGIPLLISLSWTFGLAYVAFGSLNLMTSTLALVLFGLGIDYGIHFFARYSEERGGGLDVEQAAETAFFSTGQAVAVSALTTAVALFALQLADFRGFSEFGLIGGTGIVLAMIAMLVVLPALLSLAERVGALRLDPEGTARTNRSAARRFPAARPVLMASLAATLLAIMLLPGERFEYDFDRLEPDFPAFQERQRYVSPAFSRSTLRNPAYLVVDTPEQALAVADTLRARMAADTTIAAVETPVERFPLSRALAEQRLERLATIRELADDPFLAADETGQIDRIRRAASPTEQINLADVPEELRRPFTDRHGEIGRFVVVYPRGELSHDGRLSMAFAADVGRVDLPDGGVAYAGSTSVVAAEMLRLMLAEAPWMVLITFILITVFMLSIFRSAYWTVLALLPLLIGIIWMLGGMAVAGLAFTFYNLVVLPAVLGIGNDCGVHLVHRYREEGPGSLIRLLRTTGEHITVGALTTMIGFSGLLLSFHPGLRSIGQLAVFGIGTTLLAALIFFPALIQWLEDSFEKTTPDAETRDAQLAA